MTLTDPLPPSPTITKHSTMNLMRQFERFCNWVSCLWAKTKRESQ